MRMVRRAALLVPVLVVAALLAAWALWPSSDRSKAPAADPTVNPAATDASSPAASRTAPEPVVEGARLVDARTGEVFVPVGVNWTGFEYPCAQGWGYSELDRITKENGGDAASETATIASWGANTLRLPVNQDCWLGTRGAPVSDPWVTRDAQGYRDRVVDFVANANRNGLVVIIDLHSRKREQAAEFGNLAMPDQASLDFWASAAHAFHDHPSVLFDAFNEPYSRYDEVRRQWAFELDWSCWRDGGCEPPVTDDRLPVAMAGSYRAVGMTDVVATIRGAGARQPILLSGLDYANDLSEWGEYAPDDDQLVASFHSYDFKPCGDRACWDATLAQLAATVPVVVAELGQAETDLTYVADFLEWVRPTGIGVLAWAWSDHRDDPMSLVGADRATPTSAGSTFLGFMRRLSTG